MQDDETVTEPGMILAHAGDDHSEAAVMNSGHAPSEWNTLAHKLITISSPHRPTTVVQSSAKKKPEGTSAPSGSNKDFPLPLNPIRRDRWTASRSHGKPRCRVRRGPDLRLLPLQKREFQLCTSEPAR